MVVELVMGVGGGVKSVRHKDSTLLDANLNVLIGRFFPRWLLLTCCLTLVSD